MTPVGFEPTQLALVELHPLRPLGQSVLGPMNGIHVNKASGTDRRRKLPIAEDMASLQR
jgi:hypothetical protein